MRHRPRIDATQRAIVEALRKAGCTVVSLAAVGAGCPDLLVGVKGRTYLVECKSPKATHRKASETRSTQDAWMARWRGGPVSVVHTPLEALLECSLADLGRMA